jgi:hypothetical protein
MAKSFQFTRQDTLHAAIGVIPAFLLICFGYLTPGIAWDRITDNVIGALIALFYGLLVPQVLIRMKSMQPPGIPNIKA